MKQNTILTVAAGLFVLLCVILAGCTGIPDSGSSQTAAPTQDIGTDEISGEAAESVVTANNMFAFELYKKLAAENTNPDENVFFSPFSISSALAITYEGAKEKTAEEIKTVFFFPESIDTLRNGYLAVNTGINAGDADYDLHIANALWAENTYPFLNDYITTAEEYYSADLTNLDFINKPEESRLTINKWAEEKTEEKIKNLIPAGMIDPLTRLVITNAIYFKGTWVKQFDKNNTYEADFITSSGESVKVWMMQRTDEDAIYGYTENDEFQMLKMPYEHECGKELSMIAVLPKDNDLRAVEETLDADKLAETEESLETQQVLVYFPKFRLETEYTLSETLKEMGMPTAFSAAADFSGMGTTDLFISDVVHKAYVDVNEEGTEAAAATAVVMKLTTVIEEESPVFRADHPFIFLIQDNETGNILFMGRISNPEEP
ncbi:MAG: serpin family protein [Methanogenium sp.]|nr:serpin family protein [Methanogenium sp.]